MINIFIKLIRFMYNYLRDILILLTKLSKGGSIPSGSIGKLQLFFSTVLFNTYLFKCLKYSFKLFYYLNLFLGLMFIIIIIEFTWHELFDLFTVDIFPKI
jgi:hypothetical protein